mmetsp:Transcript_93880/g.236550  ORF Transcript_93880/g.236550 Transcript_93880/m.236550 type:complete len:250 (-) Transcript_93880:88-837(-)
MFALSDSPPVSSLILFSRKGVTWFPFTPWASHSATAFLVASSTPAASAARASGTGTPSTTPWERPKRCCASRSAATASGPSRRQETGKPLRGVKKAGKSSVWYPATGTPWVSKNSKVFGKSRMLLAPAQTTQTGVRPSSVRSAEVSQDSSAPRCTPPIPPVTKREIPAAFASSIVLETVVAPFSLAATTAARSRRETFLQARPRRARASSCSGPMPMCTLPSKMPIVAGVTPRSRRMASTSRAVSTFCG